MCDLATATTAGPSRRSRPLRFGPWRPTRRARMVLVLALVAAMGLGLLGWRSLRSTTQPGAWGGHENGRIPTAELCPLGAPGQQLRCDAAAAYRRLATSYRASFNTSLCITDSYRPLASQVSAAERKPGLAAAPGTSNHGWALAVDLCGGVNEFGTRQHRWMQANAGRFGWRQPSWAARGRTRAEPWHWEFGNLEQ